MTGDALVGGHLSLEVAENDRVNPGTVSSDEKSALKSTSRRATADRHALSALNTRNPIKSKIGERCGLEQF
jgi:hypothetical protein